MVNLFFVFFICENNLVDLFNFEAHKKKKTEEIREGSENKLLQICNRYILVFWNSKSVTLYFENV